jgi:hypothetical protein
MTKATPKPKVTAKPKDEPKVLKVIEVGESNLERLQREAFLRGKGIDPKAPLQLDIWPDEVREIPNDYARSAIFTVRNKKEPRQSLQNSVIFHMEKAVRVTFTGIELRADDDELVWQQILDYAKHHALGEAVEFNLHQLCKDLKWSVNARNYERLRACITRLKANEIKVENARLAKGVGISLIREYEYEGTADKGTKYRVWIHPNLIMLFAGKNSTRVEWKSYVDLSPVARRLYDYLASHKQPFPLRLDTLHRLCASSCSTGYRWKQMVQKACAELEDAGMVKKAWVDKDTVYCER